MGLETNVCLLHELQTSTDQLLKGVNKEYFGTVLNCHFWYSVILHRRGSSFPPLEHTIFRGAGINRHSDGSQLVRRGPARAPLFGQSGKSLEGFDILECLGSRLLGPVLRTYKTEAPRTLCPSNAVCLGSPLSNFVFFLTTCMSFLSVITTKCVTLT